MKRFVGLLSAAMLAATVAVLAPTSTASADVCAGTGSATVGAPGLFYPVAGESKTLGFTFATTVGACAPPVSTGGLGATGTVQGYCGHSTGSGNDGQGHTVQWTSAGSFLVLTGEVVGVVNAVPNAAAGQSCTSGALSFLVTGVVTRQNCTTKSLTAGLTSTDLPAPAGDVGVHYSVHSCVGTQL
jgi:hypothetical protein